MCEWGNTRRVYIPAGWNGTGEPHVKWGYRIAVDECIADLVEALNRGGVSTRNSCCGRGKGPGKIDLVDGRVLLVAGPDCSDGRPRGSSRD